MPGLLQIPADCPTLPPRRAEELRAWVSQRCTAGVSDPTPRKAWRRQLRPRRPLGWRRCTEGRSRVRVRPLRAQRPDTTCMALCGARSVLPPRLRTRRPHLPSPRCVLVCRIVHLSTIQEHAVKCVSTRRMSLDARTAQSRRNTMLLRGCCCTQRVRLNTHTHTWLPSPQAFHLFGPGVVRHPPASTPSSKGAVLLFQAFKRPMPPRTIPDRSTPAQNNAELQGILRQRCTANDSTCKVAPTHAYGDIAIENLSMRLPITATDLGGCVFGSGLVLFSQLSRTWMSGRSRCRFGVRRPTHNASRRGENTPGVPAQRLPWACILWRQGCHHAKVLGTPE